MSFEEQLDLIIKEHIKNKNKALFNEIRSYKHKRTRELTFSILFIFISLLFFMEPLVNFNISLLNTVGYSLYLPIFTIETMLFPIMVGKGVEKIINQKNDNIEGLRQKIYCDAINLTYDEYLTNLDNVLESYQEGKEIILPPKINNLSTTELMEEIQIMNLKKALKINSGKLPLLSTGIILSYVFYLSLFPEVLFPVIFSSIGLGALDNTIILKLLFFVMGVTFCSVDALNYNNTLDSEKDFINKITSVSNFKEEDINNLVKAYTMKTIKYTNETETMTKNNNNKKENSNNKTKFTKITPKMVDYEFKGNPEEKWNSKVLKRKK